MNDYYSGNRYFKVFNAANYRNGYEYEDGLNYLRNIIGVDEKPFKCYFTDIKHIFAYVNYGPCFREVIIPENNPYIIEDGESFSTDSDYIPGWYSDNIILDNLKTWTVGNIKYLIENGADISINNYYLVEWALMYNFEVFYFLQEYICSKSEELWLHILIPLQERGFL